MPTFTSGNCYLCGHPLSESAPGNEDHFPPRGIFPAGTTDLLSLPAHKNCNNSKSRDEEYFRTVVTGAFHRTKEAEEVWRTRTLPNTIQGGRIRPELAELTASIVPLTITRGRETISTGMATLSSRRTSTIRKVCERTARGVMAYHYPGRKIHELRFRVDILDLQGAARFMGGLQGERYAVISRGGQSFVACFAFEAAGIAETPNGFCLMIFHDWLIARAFCGAKDSPLFQRNRSG